MFKSKTAFNPKLHVASYLTSTLQLLAIGNEALAVVDAVHVLAGLPGLHHRHIL